MVLVFVGGDGDEAALSARFSSLIVGEAGSFGRGEVELDARLGGRGIGGQFLGELKGGERQAGLAEVVGAYDLSEVEGGYEAGEDGMGELEVVKEVLEAGTGDGRGLLREEFE